MSAVWSARLLSVLRIVAALLFTLHGTAKLTGFPGGRSPVPLASLIGVAGVLETVGGLLLLLGLFTRPVALLLAGQMAVAYLIAHAPRGLVPTTNGGELAVLFGSIFLYLAAAGGGPWSVDAVRR